MTVAEVARLLYEDITMEKPVHIGPLFNAGWSAATQWLLGTILGTDNKDDWPAAIERMKREEEEGGPAVCAYCGTPTVCPNRECDHFKNKGACGEG